ncbi:MAG TPA: hypothetical protein H9903_00105 [Candidatus Aquabacterium excrementipullorum]|nr:hypothetical protein [Candidatus Aquabacterium excrementipullorum]
MGSPDAASSAPTSTGPGQRPVQAPPRAPVGDSGASSRLTLCRAGAPSDHFSWGTFEVVRWKMPAFMGGGRDYLFAYKDGWVVYYRDEIEKQAVRRGLPPWLLAGVVWNEVGGDPGWIDDVALELRAFDHLADPYLEPMTITRRPELTSMGEVSIQLRRAAQTMGLEWADLSGKERSELVSCLSDEPSNLAVVAMHLRQLADVDYRGQASLGDKEVVVIGARYNRGPHLTLEQINKDLSYGQAMLRRKDRLLQLMTPPPAGQSKP